eukprot:gene7054-2658_t
MANDAKRERILQGVEAESSVRVYAVTPTYRPYKVSDSPG